MMKKLLIVLFISMFSMHVFANEKQDISKCAAKKSNADRLICYDNLARSLKVKEPDTTFQKKGAWRVVTEKSAIDDSLNVHVSVESDAAVHSGYKNVTPTLHIRCAENKTQVFINWDLYLGIDQTMMLTRFDDTKANTDEWTISTNNKAVFVRGNNIAFAKKLMNHNKLLVQITPHGENSVMATFNIKGLSEAIKPLREACRW